MNWEVEEIVARHALEMNRRHFEEKSKSHKAKSGGSRMPGVPEAKRMAGGHVVTLRSAPPSKTCLDLSPTMRQQIDEHFAAHPEDEPTKRIFKATVTKTNRRQRRH